MALIAAIEEEQEENVVVEGEEQEEERPRLEGIVKPNALRRGVITIVDRIYFR